MNTRCLRSCSLFHSLIIAGLFCAAFPLTACSPPAPPNIVSGDSAPDFEAAEIGGQAIRFPALTDDKPSVVLVWATWCPYCKVLMPRLNQIRADYVAQGVQIVAINAKERGRGDPAAFVRDAGYDFVTVAAGGDIAGLYDVKYLPGLFVVDAMGVIVYRREWTELPAGQEVADLWEGQVRQTLDGILTNSSAAVD